MSTHQHMENTNLTFIARELAINYFNTSLYRDFDNDTATDKKLKETTEFVFENANNTLFTNDAIGYKSNYQSIEDFQEETYCIAGDRKDFLAKLGTNETWYKNILVLGAGCSADFFKGIPLGAKAVEDIYNGLHVRSSDGDDFTFGELIKAYDYSKDDWNWDHITAANNEDAIQKKENREQWVKESNVLRLTARKYYEELRRLQLYNIEGLRSSNNPDFETALYLISLFFPVSEIRKKIKDLYDFQHGPTLFYELIAHLFKHRMLDIIINFNFDELLDQSISDELGDASYKKIISDGDCLPLEELLINSKIKQPIYIKPHGTASHKSSLRYTKDHYYDLPKDISTLLIEIFSCSTKNEKSTSSESNSQSKKVNLIIAGFNMDSIEFNDILNRELPLGSRIFYFYHVGNKKDDEVRNEILSKFNRIFNLHQDGNIPELYLIRTDLKSDTSKTIGFLGDIANSLWNNTISYFNPLFAPSNISRHKVIYELLGNYKFWKKINMNPYEWHRNYFENKEYLLDRTLIELIITIFKGRGRVNPKDVIKEKSGAYYSLYDAMVALENKKRKEKEASVSYTDLLAALSSPEKWAKLNIFDPIDFDLKKLKQDDEPVKFAEYFDSLIKNIQNFEYEKKIKVISEPLKNYLISDCIDKESLGEYFKVIYNSNRSNIRAKFADFRYSIFKQFSGEFILNTHLSLDYYLHHKCSKKSGGQILLMVAETGRVFKNFREDIEKNFDKVILITADYNNEMDKGLIDDKLILRKLPPEKHNHHMALFLEIDNKKLKYGGAGVYYYQSGFSDMINPLAVSEADNIHGLLTMFCKLYQEALTPEGKQVEYNKGDEGYDILQPLL